MIKTSLENVLNNFSLSKINEDSINQENLKDMSINLKQIIFIDDENIFGGVEIPKKEKIKDIRLKNFKEIVNWNYDENGVYFQTFGIKQKNKNTYVNGIIECSIDTNKKTIFYITKAAI